MVYVPRAIVIDLLRPYTYLQINVPFLHKYSTNHLTYVVTQVSLASNASVPATFPVLYNAASLLSSFHPRLKYIIVYLMPFEKRGTLPLAVQQVSLASFVFHTRT